MVKEFCCNEIIGLKQEKEALLAEKEKLYENHFENLASVTKLEANREDCSCECSII